MVSSCWTKLYFRLDLRGHLLENLKINCLFVGNEFSKLNSTSSFFDVENLINYLKKKQIKDSTILVKGSRSIKLEKVIKVL